MAPRQASIASERKTKRELHHARIAGEPRNRSARAVADVRVGQPELVGVEDVEDLPADLDRPVGTDSEPPMDGRVDVEQAGPPQDVAPGVAEGSGRHRCASVTACEGTAVPMFLAVTVAPGTTASELSLTVPVSDARSTCAAAIDACRTRAEMNRKRERLSARIWLTGSSRLRGARE